MSAAVRGKNAARARRAEREALAPPPALEALAQGSALEALARRIIACERCPRLRAHCREVAREKRRAYRDEAYWGRPVPGFGDPRARLLIVGLAPAAHGANRTGRMFTGDSSGEWLYSVLHAHGFASQPRSESRDDGLRLCDAWVTAAARCAPPGNKPAREELARCQPWLEAEIRSLTRVRVVVTLGAIAHQAWLRAAGWWDALAPRRRPGQAGKRPPFGHGIESVLPDGTMVIASYHPSRQNTQTGRLTRAAWNAIFARARERLDGPDLD